MKSKAVRNSMLTSSWMNKLKAHLSLRKTKATNAMENKTDYCTAKKSEI